ncbi:MAG: hypothetical protein FJ257_06815 [Phycisphaerae bacterium]|nr:hypothetical protein [Phycisphaerae bacterium]
MIRSSWQVVLAASAAASLSASLLADGKKEPHLDLWVRIVEDRIVTGSITEGDPGEPVSEEERVFGAELGEDPAFPFSAVEPGFQILASKQTIGATFAFAFTGPVLRWDGAGFLVAGDAMQLGFGPAEATSGDGPAPGFAFGTEPDGSLHDHFDYTLIGPGGTDPIEGIYVLQLAFVGESPFRAPSEPCYVVFNLGLSEEDHELAERQARWLLACDLDVAGGGTVGGDDLSALLSMWGTDDPAGDLDGSGNVDGRDLSILLGAWGYECP